ncbi:MAG TPA: DUF6569 family protein [Terracidiphilus sp.]|nr:DUF6569 family protein [Terracidiphilus sp.]
MAPIRRKTDLARHQAITLDNILDTVAEQAMGFHFGKPKRIDEKALAVILPILRDGEIGRDYITYPEVTDNVIVTDSGIISKVNLENKTDQKVFIRSGTVFEGKGTQSRVITRSAILFAGQKVSLDARCVHASHGIHPGSEFGYHGTISLDIERAVYDAGFKPRDQHVYWNRVGASNSAKRAHSSDAVEASSRVEELDAILASRLVGEELEGEAEQRSEHLHAVNAPPPRPGRITASPAQTGSGRRSQSRHTIWGDIFGGTFGRPAAGAMPAADSFVANDTVFTQNLDEILSKVKLHDNQVGISLITDRGVETIELFEVRQSWSALHKASVKRMGTELIKEEKEDVFEYKPERAIEQVTRVLAMDYDANTIYEHKAEGGDRVVITGLTNASHIGEVVELGGKVIHLSLLKRAV